MKTEILVKLQLERNTVGPIVVQVTHFTPPRLAPIMLYGAYES